MWSKKNLRVLFAVHIGQPAFLKINPRKPKIMNQKFCHVNYFIIIAWFKELLKEKNE